MTHFTKGQTFTSNDQPFTPNRLIWILLPLHGWLVSKTKMFFMGAIWHWLQKVSKSAPRTIFDKLLVLWFIPLKAELLLLMAGPFFQLTETNCASSARVAHFLHKSVSTWNGLILAAKNYFLMADSSVQINSYELHFLCKGDLFP